MRILLESGADVYVWGISPTTDLGVLAATPDKSTDKSQSNPAARSKVTNGMGGPTFVSDASKRIIGIMGGECSALIRKDGYEKQANCAGTPRHTADVDGLPILQSNQ